MFMNSTSLKFMNKCSSKCLSAIFSFILINDRNLESLLKFKILFIFILYSLLLLEYVPTLLFGYAVKTFHNIPKPVIKI